MYGFIYHLYHDISGYPWECSKLTWISPCHSSRIGASGTAPYETRTARRWAPWRIFDGHLMAMKWGIAAWPLGETSRTISSLQPCILNKPNLGTFLKRSANPSVSYKDGPYKISADASQVYISTASEHFFEIKRVFFGFVDDPHRTPEASIEACTQPRGGRGGSPAVFSLSLKGLKATSRFGNRSILLGPFSKQLKIHLPSILLFVPRYQGF